MYSAAYTSVQTGGIKGQEENIKIFNCFLDLTKAFDSRP